MARLFDDASTEALENDSAPVTTYPFTFACWFYSDDLTQDQTLLSLSDKDVTNEQFHLQAEGSRAGDPVRFAARGGGGANNARTTTGYSANTWHHACGVGTSSTDRSVFIDGGSEGTSTTARSPVGIDRVSIGRRGDSTPSEYMSGRIAEAAIWSAALTSEEIVSLVRGFSPKLIRPESLVFYPPLVRDADQDFVGGLSMTAVNTPTIATHPRIIYPGRRRRAIAPVATAAYDPSTLLAAGEIGLAASGGMIGRMII